METVSDLISICIPTYNNKGTQHNESYNNLTMLEQLFESIRLQTYLNYETIISDHSKDDHIKTLCDKWKSLINIKYYRYKDNYGSAESNLNNAIKHAHGTYIKPMFQDDFFYVTNALELLKEGIEYNDNKWAICGCIHIHENSLNYENPLFPDFRFDRLVRGENTVGSPIVMMYDSSIKETFNENLPWLMDTEFYCRLYKKFTPPTILHNLLVVSRLRHDSISDSVINDKMKNHDINYCLKKYLK